MKKTKLIASVGLAAVALMSCKKDRTCECTVSSGGFSITASYDLLKVTKEQAKDICVSKVYYDNQGNVDHTQDCKLK